MEVAMEVAVDSMERGSSRANLPERCQLAAVPQRHVVCLLQRAGHLAPQGLPHRQNGPTHRRRTGYRGPTHRQRESCPSWCGNGVRSSVDRKSPHHIVCRGSSGLRKRFFHRSRSACDPRGRTLSTATSVHVRVSCPHRQRCRLRQQQGLGQAARRVREQRR